MTLLELLNDYEIIIPRIQRDYTLGSLTSKLKEFLTFIRLDSYGKTKDSMSPFIGYKDVVSKKIYIYDGQQRIVTFMILLSTSEDYKHWISKFKFEDIHKQNAFASIINGSDRAINYTGKSILNALKVISEYLDITPHVLNKLHLDLTECNKVEDIEQLMIDMNDGMEVRQYEVDRANMIGLTSLDSTFIELEILPRVEMLNINPGYDYRDFSCYDGRNIVPRGYYPFNIRAAEIVEESVYNLIKYLMMCYAEASTGIKVDINNFKYSTVTDAMVTKIQDGLLRLLDMDFTKSTIEPTVLADKFNIRPNGSNLQQHLLSIMASYIRSKCIRVASMDRTREYNILEYSMDDPLPFEIMKYFSDCSSKSISRVITLLELVDNKTISYGGGTTYKNLIFRVTTSFSNSIFLCREINTNLFSKLQRGSTNSINYIDVVKRLREIYGSDELLISEKYNKLSTHSNLSIYDIHDTIISIINGVDYRNNNVANYLKDNIELTRLMYNYIQECMGHEFSLDINSGESRNFCNVPDITCLPNDIKFNKLISKSETVLQNNNGITSYLGYILVDGIYELVIDSLLNPKNANNRKQDLSRFIVDNLYEKVKEAEGSSSLYNFFEVADNKFNQIISKGIGPQGDSILISTTNKVDTGEYRTKHSNSDEWYNKHRKYSIAMLPSK